MDWDYPQAFTLSVMPAPEDIDGLQHTNNGVYVQWCAQIGWAHSEALGLGLSDYQRLDRGMAIRRAEYDYLLPSRLHDRLTLGTWLLAGSTALTMERRFQLVREHDGVTLLRGRWELVCIALSSGQARRLPKEFSQIYGAAMVGAAGTQVSCT